MNDKKKGPLFQTTRQISIGAGVSGVGFLLYLALSAMGQQLIADIAVIAFAVVAVWTFVSAAAGRNRDKAAVSYSLLWGTGALAIMMGGCAVLTIKLWLGL